MRWNETNSGCIVDSHQGQYAVIYLIQLAQSEGMATDSWINTAILAYINAEATDDQYEMVIWLGDEALAYLNEHCAPADHLFDWFEGNVMLWHSERWDME